MPMVKEMFIINYDDLEKSTIQLMFMAEYVNIETQLNTLISCLFKLYKLVEM